MQEEYRGDESPNENDYAFADEPLLVPFERIVNSFKPTFVVSTGNLVVDVKKKKSPESESLWTC